MHLRHIALQVNNIDQSIEFYETIPELSVARRAQAGAGLRQGDRHRAGRGAAGTGGRRDYNHRRDHRHDPFLYCNYGLPDALH